MMSNLRSVLLGLAFFAGTSGIALTVMPTAARADDDDDFEDYWDDYWDWHRKHHRWHRRHDGRARRYDDYGPRYYEYDATSPRVYHYHPRTRVQVGPFRFERWR